MGEDAPLVRVPLRHVASQELQLYFERVAALLSGMGDDDTAAAASGGTGTRQTGEQTRRAILASLAADPGLQPLAPHLVHLVAQQVAANLKCLPQLRLLLRCVCGVHSCRAPSR